MSPAKQATPLHLCYAAANAIILFSLLWYNKVLLTGLNSMFSVLHNKIQTGEFEWRPGWKTSVCFLNIWTIFYAEWVREAKTEVWEKWKLRHHQMLRNLDIQVVETSLLVQVKRSLKVQKLHYYHSSFILVLKTHFIKRWSVSEMLTWQNGGKL